MEKSAAESVALRVANCGTCVNFAQSEGREGKKRERERDGVGGFGGGRRMEWTEDGQKKAMQG